MYQIFYYCNIVALLYIFNLLLIKLKLISLNSPISMAIYLLTWLIPLLGFPFVLFFGYKIRQRFNTSKNFRYIILFTHLIVLIPLLKFIPYRDTRITYSEMVNTFFYILLFFILYIILVKKNGISLAYIYGF